MSHDLSKRVEVHTAAIILSKRKGNIEVFLAKRAPNKRIYPNLWEGSGGQLEPGETFNDGLRREVLEETGLDVKVICPVTTYSIPVPERDQKLIPGVKFLCILETDKEPVIGREHTECRWQSVNKLHELELIPGIEEDISKAVKLYNLLINLPK